MLGFILILFLIIAAAFANIAVINKTLQARNKEAVWFSLVLGDFIATILAIKLYENLSSGIEPRFAAILRIILVITGILSLGGITYEIMPLLKRNGGKRNEGNAVLILDIVLLAVILGLYLLK